MQILGNVFYVFEWVVPCHLLNKNTLGEYIFVRKYFQGTYFCKLCLKNCKFRRRYFRDLRPKVNLAVTLMFIKHYLTLFWQFAWLDLIFQKRHFLALSQKYILLKIFSTKISCNIYNIYNRNLRNDARSMLRERERERERNRIGATILATFLINIFCLVFYVNIQPSCSKTKIEYFNIKIRLLFRET